MFPKRRRSGLCVCMRSCDGGVVQIERQSISILPDSYSLIPTLSSLIFFFPLSNFVPIYLVLNLCSFPAAVPLTQRHPSIACIAVYPLIVSLVIYLCRYCYEPCVCQAASYSNVMVSSRASVAGPPFYSYPLPHSFHAHMR